MQGGHRTSTADSRTRGVSLTAQRTIGNYTIEMSGFTLIAEFAESGDAAWTITCKRADTNEQSDSWHKLLGSQGPDR